MTSSLAPALNQMLHRRVFYGWLMLGVGFLGLFCSSPGQTYTISIILNALIDEFEVTRTAVSSAYSIGTVTAAFGLPYLGRLVDRAGPRFMLAGVAGGLGVACLLFPLSAGLASLYVAFTALRFLGQGSMTLISFNLVSQWFWKKRGLALTLATMGGGLGSATFPPVLQWLVSLYGWRVSYMLLGLFVIAVVVPISLLFVANRPEELGLRPDGQATTGEGAAQAEADARRDEEESWTRGEALRHWVFWFIAVANALPAMLITGMMFHQVSFFEQQGLTAAIAARLFTVFSIAQVGTTLVYGPLLDRLPTRFTYPVGLLLLPVTMWVMVASTTVPIAIAYAVLLGITAGAYFPAANYIWPRYFGRGHLGSIQGVGNTALVIGAAIGPLPFGMAYDLLGSYLQAVLVQSVLPLMAGLALLFIRPPRRPGRTGEAAA